jgi:hypothetical protein
MRKHFHTALCVIGIAAPASAQSRLAKPTIDTVNHHIVRVVNAGPSQWLGTTGWKLVLERTITADGTTAVIAQPITLAVDRLGRIVETDWKVDGIQVFEPDGRFARLIGRSGAGPGEFRAPVGIDVRGDTIAAFAGNQRRMSLWRTDGSLLSEWRANLCCTTAPVIDPHGDLLLWANTRVGSVNRRVLVRLHRDGRVADSTLIPADPPIPEWIVNGGAYSIPFSAWTHRTFDTHGRYISGNSAHYTLVVALHGSDTARIIELPGRRAPVSGPVADSVFAGYARIAVLAGIAKRGDLPTEQPYFTGLHADENDNVWIERPAADGRIAAFDVISPDGSFLGTVAAPRVSPRLALFRNGRMYCIAETADGDAVIQVYRIDRSGR